MCCQSSRRTDNSEPRGKGLEIANCFQVQPFLRCYASRRPSRFDFQYGMKVRTDAAHVECMEYICLFPLTWTLHMHSLRCSGQIRCFALAFCFFLLFFLAYVLIFCARLEMDKLLLLLPPNQAVALAPDARRNAARAGRAPNSRASGSSAFSRFHLIRPSHSANLCQLVDCQFLETHFWRGARRVSAAGPPSIAPSNTATNWNVVPLWESSQDLN